MSGNRKLREALDAVSSLTDWNVYLHTLKSCRTQFDHGITVLPDGKGRLRRFNCYAYALGLSDHADYISAVDLSMNSAIVDTRFMKSMVQRGLLVERSSPQLCAGDVVRFFRQPKPSDTLKVLHSSQVDHG